MSFDEKQDDPADETVADAGRRVFVSHSSGDREPAFELVAQLESRGIRCWVAPRDVEAGSKYAESILDGIESCEVFVLLLSQASNDSDHVQRELERAAHGKKRIVPVRLEDLEPTGSMDYFLAGLHRVDAFGKQSGREFVEVAEQIQRKDDSGKFVSHPSMRKTHGKRRKVALWLVAVFLVGAAVYYYASRNGEDRLGKARDLIKEGQIFNANQVLHELVADTPAGEEVRRALKEVETTFKTLGPETVSELGAIPNDFELKLWIDSDLSEFPFGKEIPLRIQSEIDCHIVVLCRVSDGSDVVLYPNADYRETFLRAGEVRALPGPSLMIKASPPAGIDVIYAIAVSEKSALEKFTETIQVDWGPEDPFAVFSGPKKKGVIIEKIDPAKLDGTQARFSARVISVETVD